MNTITKEELKAFIQSVEYLAQGVIHMAGMETVKDVIEKAERLKDQLDRDVTIV